jgi:type IV secretion system protein VirD4
MHPAIFVEGACIAASGGFISIGVAIGMSVWRAREAKNVATYGSARWATAGEARRAGLIGPDGVVLGKLGADYLRHEGPEHVLCFAPTRSGKGVGLVVPTLLTWPGSSIVHDIKGENWELTSGFRSRHGRVLLFDPTNAASAAYNPLLEVRRGEWEVRDVQNIADVLVDPEGALERRNHWEKTSHALLVGAILHVLYAGEDKTLAGVAAFLSDPRQPIETTLRAMMTTAHLGEAGVHPVIASAARELLNKSENERSGVLSTAMSFLGLYRDPVVAQVTRRCDWRIRDLVENERPTTLYLVVPPSDISRTKPLVRLVLNQIGRRLTEELHAKGGGTGCCSCSTSFLPWGAWISSNRRSPSWRAMGSRVSSSPSRSIRSRKPTVRTTPSSTTAMCACASPPTTSAPPSASRTRSARRRRFAMPGTMPAIG